MVVLCFFAEGHAMTQREKYADEVVKTFIEEAKRDLNLIPNGSGGSMPSDIENLSVFFIAPRQANVKEARELEVKAVEKLLSIVNSHEKIQPYLRESPFDSSRAIVLISFPSGGENQNSRDNLRSVSTVKGKIFYDVLDPSGNRSIAVEEEPYEEALAIVMGKSLQSSMSQVIEPALPKKPIEPISAEQEFAYISACGKTSTLPLSKALRELMAGLVGPEFEKEFIEGIAKVEADRLDGEYVRYWAKDQKKITASFKKGKVNGHVHGWYEDGTEAFKAFFDEEKKVGIHIAFFPPEAIRKNNRKNPRVKGRVVCYDDKSRFSGEVKSYYLDGTLKTLTEYEHGLINGIKLLCSDDGKDIENVQYKKGKLIKK